MGAPAICCRVSLVRVSSSSTRRGGGEGQVGMAPGVIADQVPGGQDAPDQRRLGLGKAAHKKEGGTDVVAGQRVEQAGRPGGVGAVVEGERQLAGAARGNQRRAKQL